MITQVKWNDGMPDYKAIEGKLLLAEIRIEDTSGSYKRIVLFDKFGHGIQKVNIVRYSILSDEPVYCEWSDSRNGLYEPSCTKGFRFTGDAHLCYPYCPKCGLPIKVIDELKPLPLMGIEPKIEYSEGSDGHLWTYYWYSNGIIISSNAFDSKREAIVSWNEFVKRVSKE